MKKLTIMLIGLMIFMFGPSIANAATSMTVSVSCKDVTINKTTTCTVTGKATGGSISGVEGKYSISGGASLSNYAVGSGWLGEGSGGSFSNYTDSNKSNTFTIGTFTLKGTSVGKVTLTLSGVLGFDANYNEISVKSASATFNVTAATTKATTTKNAAALTQKTTAPTTTLTTTSAVPLILTSVKVDDFYVSFEDGVYYATVNAETEKVTISATAGGGITIVGTGQRTLAVGQNAVDLVLRNGSNQTATFQLIITRPEGMVISDTKLTSLKIVGYTFAFSPDTKEYTVSIPSSVDEIYVLAQSYSDDVIITGDGLQALKKGKNTIYLRASYGELATTEYVINIKRSYMSVIMWIIIGILGAGIIALGIYANINRKAAVSKAIAEKNKAIAQNHRAEMANSAPQVQLNGESVVGTGKRAVVPTPVQTVATPVSPVSPAVQTIPTAQVAPVSPVKPTVVENASSANQQMIKTAPPAQVKVVKATVVPVQQPSSPTPETVPNPQPTVVSTSTDKPVI